MPARVDLYKEEGCSHACPFITNSVRSKGFYSYLESGGVLTMADTNKANSDFNIFGKLFITHSSVGLIAIIVASVIFYSILRAALIGRALDQLSSINVLKKHLVQDYLYRSRLNLEALQVEDKFQNIFHEITNRSHDDRRHDIADIYALCRLYDYTNLHIFDTRHHQLFSTDEQMYPDSLLRRLDNAIAGDRRRIHIIDATPYAEKKEALLFYYVPVISNDSLVGVVLVQDNFRKIQRILLENTNMGATGETYITGSDFLLRSRSRFFPDSASGIVLKSAEIMNKLAKGQEGQGIFKDYRNVSVLSAFRSIDNEDVNWFLLSEMDESEAMRPIVMLRNYFMLVTVLIMFFVLVVTYFISDAIVTPVVELKDAVQKMAKGIIPRPKPEARGGDEIGEMTVAIQQLIDESERTAQFAREIGQGNFQASYSARGNEDALGHALIKMREELKEFHSREIRSAHSRAAALLEGQETERTRIVKELHDGVGQLLTAIRMQIDLLDGDTTRKNDLKKNINEAVAEVKRISYNVMPQTIVDFGLEAALRDLCESVRRYAPFEIDYRFVKDSGNKLDFDVTMAIYRIMQEGLNNVIKHAQASRVSLYVMHKDDELYAVLEDNGTGFDLHAMTRGTSVGSGLRNIRDRAQFMNGTAEIQSTPDEGTVIEVHIPITENAAESRRSSLN